MSKSSASIRIPDDVSAALDRAAKQCNKSQSELIVEALRAYLGAYDAAAARREADRICKEINEADAKDPELQDWVESMQAPVG